MIHVKDCSDILFAFNCKREGDYDYYDEDINECPVCGALYPELFYIDDDENCVGCDVCVHETEELC